MQRKFRKIIKIITGAFVLVAFILTMANTLCLIDDDGSCKACCAYTELNAIKSISVFLLSSLTLFILTRQERRKRNKMVEKQID